jgi:mannose-6-phosphate isomerase class I
MAKNKTRSRPSADTVDLSRCCFSGGGVMRTPEQTVDITPGSFVVHPPGELHAYTNGAHRTMLFRVRYDRSNYIMRMMSRP